MSTYVLRRYNVIKRVNDEVSKNKLISEGYELIESDETPNPPVDNTVEELKSKVEANTTDINKIKTDISALQEAIKKLNGSQK